MKCEIAVKCVNVNVLFKICLFLCRFSTLMLVFCFFSQSKYLEYVCVCFYFKYENLMVVLFILQESDLIFKANVVLKIFPRLIYCSMSYTF